MKKRFTLFVVLLPIIVSLLAGCGGAPNVDWDLKITGDVSAPLTLSYKELAKMELIDLADILMEKSVGEDEITSWSGVPLAAVFEMAGVSDYSTVTAIAADGYAVEIPADELEGGIVALKDGDEWIAEKTPDKGPVRLVTPQTPANRWVYQLIEIQIHQ